jgi:histone arginine demethylase JMJD6
MPLDMFCDMPHQHIERCSGLELTLEQFIEKYDRPGVPVIITDVVSKWPANREWTKENLLRRYALNYFKVDEVDDDGEKMHMTLSDYLAYSEQNHDEDPIYLFDPHYGIFYPELLSEYEVPIYFREDLFEVLMDGTKAERVSSSFHSFKPNSNKPI